MKARRIELHIDELVLDGFETADHQGIHDALGSELQRLFTEQGIPPALTRQRKLPAIQGGGFDVSAGASAEILGTHIAQSIYSGMKK